MIILLCYDWKFPTCGLRDSCNHIVILTGVPYIYITVGGTIKYLTFKKLKIYCGNFLKSPLVLQRGKLLVQVYSHDQIRVDTLIYILSTNFSSLYCL